MLYTANTSFAGVISMSKGEQRELTEAQAALLAPYVDPVLTDGEEVKPDEDVGNKPVRRKGKAKD